MKVLDLTLPAPAENLACDEALLDAAESGESGEVLRFWESSEHFVVVGYANKIASEVNLPACAARKIPVLRRCSGGGTVVQGPGCLSYAVILAISESGPTRNISSANQFVMEQNRQAIASLVESKDIVRIQGHTDLAIDGLKFSGNSQRRRKHYLLFHGTLLLNFDLNLVSDILHFPSQQPDYRANRSHASFIANLDLPLAKVKEALASAWNANEPPAKLPNDEIKKLVADKYSTPAWNEKF